MPESISSDDEAIISQESNGTTQKNINFMAKHKLWVQTVLIKRCTTLWNWQRKEQYLFLTISQHVALLMLYGRD